MYSTAMVRPAALDQANVAFFFSGCFAVTVTGLLLTDVLLLRV
jgi:hypothetical protein